MQAYADQDGKTGRYTTEQNYMYVSAVLQKVYRAEKTVSFQTRKTEAVSISPDI